ncbi:MAG: hypothetical protein QF888_07950 [Desulfobacterales bacterium]|nr:hypothetical protein [Desulfobacterales bacterium]
MIIQLNLSSLSEMTVNPPDRIVRSCDHLKESMLFIPNAERNGWIVDKPPEFTVEGRLMAAILLMHLIDHTYLSSSNL